MSDRKHVSMAVLRFVATLVFLYAAINNGTSAAEPSDTPKGSRKETDPQVKGFPKTAFEYAKMVEPELGVPPRINLGEGVEIPIYVDGVKTKGNLGDSCDNPSRLGKGCISGSVLQRHEGRTADGKPLPNVLWVSFGRNSSFTLGSFHILGSVQMIGYNEKTGATAFFESSDAIEPWASVDPEADRLVGVMPWIDEPEEFNKAFRTPGKTQCVACHQKDPFINNSFIDAAKIPGTDETVVPQLAQFDNDPPYYVIGGDDWDMRSIHIEDNGCFECHHVGMGTLKLFMSNGWDPNEHMPPDDPGSLADDLRELLDAWRKGPDNTPGAEWIIPPARGKDRKVVGDDYPYKAAFNQPGTEKVDTGKALGKEKAAKDGTKSADASLEQLGQKLKQAVSDGKMTEEEAMTAYEKAVQKQGKGKR